MMSLSRAMILIGFIITFSYAVQDSINCLSPIQLDSTKKGTLIITAYPESTSVFINGCKIGVGLLKLNGIRSGVYRIELRTSEKAKLVDVVVHPDSIDKVSIDLERKMYFIFEPMFSQWLLDGKICVGPALEMGLKYKRFSYTINFSWDFFYQSFNYDAFGGGFAIHYDYPLTKWLIIAPGATVGLWTSDGSDGSVDLWHLYFVAPSLKLKIGHKRVFALANYSLVLGSYISQELKIGMAFEL